MKIKSFYISFLLLFAAELTALIVFSFQKTNACQDAAAVNDVLQDIQKQWNDIDAYQNQTNLDYVALDNNGFVLFKTKAGLSESINKAIINRDTILDVTIDGKVNGKLIIDNNSIELIQTQKQKAVIIFVLIMLIQCVICIGILFHLHKTIVMPFQKLEIFARRIADGNLDLPLEMDKKNIFGAFTEGFDIMRSQLKKAKRAEAEANASKKELVAKLSHDIKTPIASIKAVSELGFAITEDEMQKNNYRQIIQKTDQINTLITNLFTATLEDLRQLTITPADITSKQLKKILENSDYLRRAAIPELPDSLLYADQLRLQQVFDNLFANSYKYADTSILLTTCQTDHYFTVTIEDMGGGVNDKELPLLKEKFKRGSNAKEIEGAGLGLYISDYFMEEMQGSLLIENGKSGLKVSVSIPFSGAVS